MSAERFPMYRGFEYHVRLRVSIPGAWAELLRDVALRHYDLWCRECAKDGKIRALCKGARDGEFPWCHPVEWQDLDLFAKIMEQADYCVTRDQERACIAEINQWIRQMKDCLLEREEALRKWDSEKTVLLEGPAAGGERQPAESGENA
jgi:hypothetical protein